MALLPTTQTTTMSDVLDTISLYKYNPSAIQATILNSIQTLINGNLDFSNPTSPFIFALEAASMIGAAGINESKNNLAALYPSLATSFDDLYKHMSDSDYDNIFATPATTNFYLLLEQSSLMASLISGPNDTQIATIGGNSYITINNVVFSFQYPINITYYPSDNLVLEYDFTNTSPLLTISNNLINYTIYNDSSGSVWYMIQLPLVQIDIISQQIPINNAVYFNQTIQLTNQYCMAKVYQQNTTGGDWIEIPVTYSLDVYDPNTATALIQLVDTETVRVLIPPIYVYNGLVSGTIRIDIYETNGSISINLGNFIESEYTISLDDLNENSSNTSAIAAMSNVSMQTYSIENVIGGTDGLTFDQLKAMVIQNATINQTAPVTINQLQALGTTYGFTLIPNVDVISDRIFLATKDLPLPVNQQFNTPPNVSMERIGISMLDLNSVSTAYVANNYSRAVIYPSTMYQDNNGILSIYSSIGIQQLSNESSANINTVLEENTLYYSPYYYVLDATTSEFTIRVYDYDIPQAYNLNFMAVNTSVEYVVNTGSYSLTKTSTGFQLTIVTSSNTAYQNLPDGNIGVQLNFTSPVDGSTSYLSGVLQGLTSAGERVFIFNIPTTFDTDSDNNLYIQGNASNLSYTIIPIAITQVTNIIYYILNVPSTFTPSTFQSMVAQQLIVSSAVSSIIAGGISYEQLTLIFGTALTNLWTNEMSVPQNVVYETYPENVPLVYTSDVYQQDTQTGALFTVTTTTSGTSAVNFTILHNAGDPVLDSSGNQVYQFLAGDTVLDNSGNPVTLVSPKVIRYFDILLLEPVFYFTTNPSILSYIDSVLQTIDSYSTTELEIMQSKLIEQTQLFYKPIKSQGQISVNIGNNQSVDISAIQSLTVNVYVPLSTYQNTALMSDINTIIIQTIYSGFTNTTISVTSLESSILSLLGNEIISINISGLGGSSNYNVVTINDSSQKLSIGKQLIDLYDGTRGIEDAITILYTQL